MCIQTLHTGTNSQDYPIEVAANSQVPAHEDHDAATNIEHSRVCSGWPRRNLVRAPLALVGYYAADAVSSVGAERKAFRSQGKRGLGLALRLACGVALCSMSGAIFIAIARASSQCAGSETSELSMLQPKLLANIMVLAACLFANNAKAAALFIRLLESGAVAIGVLLCFATSEWGCQLNLVHSALVSCIISAWKPLVLAHAANCAVRLLCTHLHESCSLFSTA